MLSLEEWGIMRLHDLFGPYHMYESCYYGGIGGGGPLVIAGRKASALAKVVWPRMVSLGGFTR